MVQLAPEHEWLYQLRDQDSKELARTMDIASTQLNESASRINTELQNFRNVLLESKYPDRFFNNAFLLAFLRHSKYDLIKAKKRVEQFWNWRLVHRPEWFEPIPISDPDIDKYFDTGHQIPLGHIRDGSVLLLVRPAAWKPSLMHNDKFRRCFLMNTDRGLFENRIQIYGVTLFVDFSGMEKRGSHSTRELMELKDEMKIWQEAFPFRVKQIIYYKHSFFLDMLLKCVEYWLQAKIRTRIIHSRNHIDKLFQKVPGLEQMLPIEYSGQNGSLNTHIELQRNEFKKFYGSDFSLYK